MNVAHPDEFEESIDNQDAQGSDPNQQDGNAQAESAGGRDSEANNPIIINK